MLCSYVSETLGGPLGELCGTGDAQALLDVTMTSEAFCGNGFFNHGLEGCDDGNLNDGDGCSSICTVEAGYYCVGSPSVCTTLCTTGSTDLTMPVVFSSAADAEAGLGPCTSFTDATFDFEFDQSFGPLTDITSYGIARFAGAFADNPCDVLPNAVAIDEMWVDAPGVVDIVCSDSFSIGDFSLMEAANPQRIILDNVPNNVVLMGGASLEMVIGEQFDSLSGLCQLSGLAVVFDGLQASAFPNGPMDCTAEDVSEFIARSTSVIRTFEATFTAGMTHSSFSFSSCSGLESFISHSLHTAGLQAGFVGNPDLRFIWIDDENLSGSEYALRIGQSPSLERVILPRFYFDAGEPFSYDGQSPELCCTDMQNAQSLRKYADHTKCSFESCDRCADVPGVTGKRACVACECGDEDCFGSGTPEGSHTVCSSEALHVAEDARETLCLNGISLKSSGTLTGDNLVVRSKLSVSEAMVLEPIVLGACSEANSGTLSTDATSGLLHECQPAFGWLPVGAETGTDSVVLDLSIDGVVRQTNGPRGSVLGKASAFVRDRCQQPRGAWATNGEPSASNHVSLPSAALFPMGLEMRDATLSLWLRIDSVPSGSSGPVVVVQHGNGTDAIVLSVLGSDAGAQAGFLQATLGGEAVLVSSSAPSLGVWHHVAVVRHHVLGQQQLFLDGVLNSKQSSLVLRPITALGGGRALLGHDPTSPLAVWDGALDNVHLTAAAVSPSVLAALAAQSC